MHGLELGMMASVLGRRLHISRLDADMTAAALAEIVGVTPGYLSKIERGRAVNVKLEIAQADLDAAHRQASPVANWGL